MDNEKKALELFDEMKKDLLESEEGKQVWEEAKEIVEPVLKDWARAQANLLLGNDAQKLVAREIIKAAKDTIRDLKDALQARLTNYLMDKLISEIKDIALKYLLPAVLTKID